MIISIACILIIVAATSPTKDDVRVDKVNRVASVPGVWEIGQHLVVIMITRIIIIIVVIMMIEVMMR